jgi:hypothetical protein
MRLLPYCLRVSHAWARAESRALLAIAAIASLAALALLPGCGGEDVHPVTPESQSSSANGTNVEVAELEVSGTGVDRFAACPPPGELGQDWIPPIPPWTPSSTAPPADAPGPPPPDDATMHGQTPTERAIADTREYFRACWHHSLIYDPTQNGHVAIVLRVGPDGRVAQVESYGACDLSSEAVQCMKDTAKKLRFRPPAGGSDTVTIPAVFTSDTIQSATPMQSAVYATPAYIAVEGLRPALHACESSARQSGHGVVASGTFTLDVGSQGKVDHVNIDPWSGDKGLLACAASAFGAAQFPPPPGGRATVLARVAFNPRAGTK